MIQLRAATPLRNMKGKKFRLFYEFLIKFLGFLTKFVGKFVGEHLSHAAKEKPGKFIRQTSHTDFNKGMSSIKGKICPGRGKIWPFNSSVSSFTRGEGKRRKIYSPNQSYEPQQRNVVQRDKICPDGVISVRKIHRFFLRPIGKSKRNDSSVPPSGEKKRKKKAPSNSARFIGPVRLESRKNRFIGYIRFIGSPDWEEEKKKKARQNHRFRPIHKFIGPVRLINSSVPSDRIQSCLGRGKICPVQYIGSIRFINSSVPPDS